MKVVASIEARTGSTRMPGKMLSNIGGKSVLSHVINRLQKCSQLDDIILATTHLPGDDALEEIAQQEGIKVYRGDVDNVMDRIIQAHLSTASDVVVEICGDCPFIDPQMLDDAIATYRKGGYDLLTNSLEVSYPKGMEFQIFRLETLIEISKVVDSDLYREHVPLYFYENHDKFKFYHLIAPSQHHAPHLRLVLDYPEDFDLIKTVHDILAETVGAQFQLEDIVKLLKQNPELCEINSCHQ